jgi:hypothetical protein
MERGQVTARIVFVGEDNPVGGSREFALWDEPAGCSGHRLRQILGLSEQTYRGDRIARTNLCLSSWHAPTARAAARGVAESDYEIVVMLGAKVRREFGRGVYRAIGAVPFFEHWVGRVGGAPQPDLFQERESPSTRVRKIFLSLPHPSGLCREWNEPTSVIRARLVLRELAPWVPWGETA